MKRSRTALGAALGIGLLASLAVVPASSATAAPSVDPGQVSTPASVAAYQGSAESQADIRAFFTAVMKSALAKQQETGATAVTVTYDASGAPTFQSQIAASEQIWNSAVTNVTLTSGSNADFAYYEGNDPRGSYASTDGHGSGYIFLDYSQNQTYDSTRVTAHETGHVLGLPDNYAGPCSELMSGGGPGPSCTNSQPNAQEAARVDQLWANGVNPMDLFDTLTTR